MSKVTVNSIVLGQSGTAANNFLLDTDAAGALRIRRNADGSGATVLNVDSSNRMSGTITQGTAINTTSGTAHDFTGIPSWAKRITVMLNGVSTNGTSAILVQLGSGSVQATGYAGSSMNSAGAALGTSNYTTGIGINNNAATANKIGSIVFTLLGSNLWVASGVLGDSTQATSTITAGNVTLSGTLDRIRLTTVNGTDTFDAGSFNILIEG